MINIITSPDFISTGNKKIFLINVSFDVFHLILSYAKTMNQDVDFFVTAGQVTDQEWFAKVANSADKIFKDPDFDIVHQYLKELNE